MAQLDHTPGAGCIVLEDEIVYFEQGQSGQTGEPILVIDYEGKLVVVTKLAPSCGTSDDPGYVYARLAGTPENVRSKLPFIGVVTRRVSTKVPGQFPITADVARGMTNDANRGDRLRQRIRALISKAANDGQFNIAVELQDTPDEDRQALNRELWYAGFNPTISERPLKQIAYGDDSDVYLLTCSWARKRDEEPGAGS